jgi:hypothetical protein
LKSQSDLRCDNLQDQFEWDACVPRGGVRDLAPIGGVLGKDAHVWEQAGVSRECPQRYDGCLVFKARRHAAVAARRDLPNGF